MKAPNTSKIYCNQLSIKETREYLKECLMDRLGTDFDKRVWILAWSKYKRLCDLYNDVAMYSREMEEYGDGQCLGMLLDMYNESSAKAASTYNREHRRELQGR